MTIDKDILQGFTPISLEEMGNVRLMNRIDTKFVTDISKVKSLLFLAASDFYIQDIEGNRNMPYYTCYFDTEGTDMFYQHQRGKKTRQKIRIREYIGSSTPAFLEVKSKNNKGRTGKKRTAMLAGNEIISYSDFLSQNTKYLTTELYPRIENRFSRITLVNKAMTERITIDTGLEFHNLTNNNRSELHKIAIIEWKRDGLCSSSGFERLLRELRIHPMGFSKYCMGMAITDGSLRQNRLKTKIRSVEKIIRG